MPELAAVTMVKDEEDIIDETIKNLVCQDVDFIIVADNGSTDHTRPLLEKLRDAFASKTKILVQPDPDPAYYQSKKITALARQAWEMGATHILPFDADELWYSSDGKTLKEVICSSDDILAATVFEHRCTLLDPIEFSPFLRMGWRLKEPLKLNKLAFKYREEYTVAQGNHLITSPEGRGISANPSKLVVRHYPYRSPHQFLRKVENGGKAYALTTLPESVGAHWRQYYKHLEGQGPTGIYEIYLQHFFYPRPWSVPDLVLDPAGFRDNYAGRNKK